MLDIPIDPFIKHMAYQLLPLPMLLVATYHSSETQPPDQPILKARQGMIPDDE